MTAIGHLSTGLLLKGRFKDAPLGLLMWAAALPDILWAILNLVPEPGQRFAEITWLSRPFTYLGDQHLLAQPWSHALVSQAALGVALGGFAFLAYRRIGVAIAVLLAVLGHWVLDFLVHDADLTLGMWPGAAHVGPPFSLDAADPSRGLTATAPLFAFALQGAVVAISTSVFFRAFPTKLRRGHLWFAAGMAVLVAASLPMYLPGVLTGRIDSTRDLVVGALVELVVVGASLRYLTGRLFGDFLPRSPASGPDDIAVPFVKRLLTVAGGLMIAIAAMYATESLRPFHPVPTLPALGLVMAGANLLVGVRLIKGDPGAIWLALIVAWGAAPMLRLCVGTGRLGLPTALVELALGLLCLFVVKTLRTRDLLL